MTDRAISDSHILHRDWRVDEPSRPMGSDQDLARMLREQRGETQGAFAQLSRSVSELAATQQSINRRVAGMEGTLGRFDVLLQDLDGRSAAVLGEQARLGWLAPALAITSGLALVLSLVSLFVVR